jgi:prevent-host-death family protein
MHAHQRPQGVIAETAIAAEAAKLGFDVYRPVAEGGRYDLVVDVGHRLLRMQCKWATRKDAVVVVRLTTCRLTPRGYVRTTYDASEIDGVAAHCPDLARCFWLPVDEIAHRSYAQLRLSPARNGQRAGLRWAEQYSFGAIAQLGERLTGSQEVGGSNPPSSISTADGHVERVGAHEFRERFGWYLERSSQGEAFLITRRGKPYARLTPPA